MPPFAEFWMAAHRHHGRRRRRRHGGPPRWIFEMMGHGPRRAERGEVRFLILDALRDQPRHGYDIIQTIESRSSGGYRPSAGVVYPTLQLLEEMGQVKSVDKDGRRSYELTDAGRTELEAHQEEVEDAYDRFSEDSEWDEIPEFHHVFTRIPRLFRAVGMGFRRGKLGSAELKQIHEILDQAIEEIEKIVKPGRRRRRDRDE